MMLSDLHVNGLAHFIFIVRGDSSEYWSD